MVQLQKIIDMRKISLKDLGIDPKKLKATKIDFSDAEVRKIIENTQRQQAECRKRMKIDMSQLNRRITI